MSDVDLHHICDTAPHCLCAGDGENPWDECCCIRQDDFRLTTTCQHCGEPMYAIHFDTGERLDEMATLGAVQ